MPGLPREFGNDDVQFVSAGLA